MTLFDVQRLFAHWSRFPPLRRIVAGFVGFKPAEPPSQSSNRHLTADEAKSLFSSMAGQFPKR